MTAPALRQGWILRDDAAKGLRWTPALITRVAGRLARDCADRGWTPLGFDEARLAWGREAFGESVAVVVSARCAPRAVGVDAARAWWLDRLLAQADAENARRADAAERRMGRDHTGRAA